MRKIEVHPGDRYGCYTVLGRAEKTASQELYSVRCDICGSEWTIGKTRLRSGPCKCRNCRGRDYREMMMLKRRERIGEVHGGYKIIDVDTEPGNGAHYLVECLRCGRRSKKNLGNLKAAKGGACPYCPPDYHFEIKNGVAVGELADGTKFKVDEEDIPIVEAHSWYVNGGGYMFHRSGTDGAPLRLHREIMGLKADDGKVIDHINHDKLDNRKCNLRVTTQAENCVNNIKRCSNTIGHIGLRIAKNGNFYYSRIEKGGQAYNLLRTDDVVEAAQAYNIAADYLFGVGIGFRNRVLYPEQNFTCAVIEKIKAVESVNDAETSCNTCEAVIKAAV